MLGASLRLWALNTSCFAKPDFSGSGYTRGGRNYFYEAALVSRLRQKLVARFDAAVRWRANEEAERALRSIRAKLDWTADELHRVGSQVAALEERLENHRLALRTERLDGDESGHALAVLRQAEREHERVRARLMLVSHYVQRLEKVEGELAQILIRRESS